MINVTRTTLPSQQLYLRYLKKIWENNWITNQGEFSLKLREELERYLKVKNLSVVSNGTLAIQLACKALELKGEVITTPFTFPATTNALLWEGLQPVFADIDPETFNIDPKEVEKKITPRTSAILAVHVFGNPCDVKALEQIGKKYNIRVIYDAAHAFGIEYEKKSILHWGDINTLSFHAAKTFHTIEGGAIISQKKKWHKTIELLCNHGIQTYDKVVIPGTNAKMNEFEAVMGLCLLKQYERDIRKRKRIYEKYRENFQVIDGLQLQKLDPNMTKYTYPYFPVAFSSEKIAKKVYSTLFKNGVRARRYFYPPCHEFPYIRASGIELENATRISHTILCLPLYADLELSDVSRIITIIREIVT